MRPVAWSISVVWTVAISCRPRLFRTISRPLESGAYRKLRSPPPGSVDRIVAVSDFSGLASSDWAFASAAAIAPIELLHRCTAGLPSDRFEADGAGFRP